jgi:hypothetical protein
MVFNKDGMYVGRHYVAGSADELTLQQHLKTGKIMIYWVIV